MRTATPNAAPNIRDSIKVSGDARQPAWKGSGRLRGFLHRLVAQRPAQNLADIGLRQLGAEFDVLRTLVVGELVDAELEHILLRQRRILLDAERLHRLA